MPITITDPQRRRFLKRAATLTAGASVATALQAFSARQALAAAPSTLVPGPYGPLAPARDLSTGLELLQLPKGFRYRSFSWTGDLMEDGNPVPLRHDGMGVVRSYQQSLLLIRNHENDFGSPIQAPRAYDPISTDGVGLAGGTTIIQIPRLLDREAKTWPGLGGTQRNCAGGITPWGTWLSCEETLNDYRAQGGKKHGYVFEVSPNSRETTAIPLVGMGRFAHEAAAVDPVTSAVYLSEDAWGRAGYYRYLPNDTRQRFGSLARGGRLQAARVKGLDNALLYHPSVGDSYPLSWVTIADPDADPDDSGSGPYRQAQAKGGLSLSRGEGLWYHQGCIYVVDTAAGNYYGVPGNGLGCVWQHNLRQNTLTCIYAPELPLHGNHPDNITASPRGQVVFCEDGGGVDDAYGFGNRLLSLTNWGAPYILVKNNAILNEGDAASVGKNVPDGDYRSSEFCGVCFDPMGAILFVNIQTPGITFAIWGHW